MGEGEGGAPFISEGGCPIGGELVLVGEGFRKKSYDEGCARPIHASPPPRWETLCVDIELFLCMLSSAMHVFCMYVLFYKHY